jgi:hypothetical protein
LRAGLAPPLNSTIHFCTSLCPIMYNEQ